MGPSVGEMTGGFVGSPAATDGRSVGVREGETVGEITGILVGNREGL